MLILCICAIGALAGILIELDERWLAAQERQEAIREAEKWLAVSASE